MQLGRYRLDEQVGQGGMAVVWRGFDTQLRRVVAVKVLHPHLHGREEIRKRFAREAQAVARLHHPHILDVFDSSDPDAEPSWLVMEFVLGTNLRAFGDAHPFDPPELAASSMVPIAEALEHAHQGGVIHRDLKPENVMVREDGTIKLTDFGIAAIVEPDEKFTATGQILGSPAHLAPEIIEGRPASAQSDLFSLGTMLYWLSCGKLPFLAPTPASLLRLIMECKPVDPRMIRPTVSDGQARLVMKCLARDPAARPAGAGELARELVKLLAESGIDDPREEFARFVRSRPPEEHARGLRARLVSASLVQAEAALGEKRTTHALAAFSRALSLDPSNERAKTQVERIHQRSRRARLVRRSALGASLAVLVGLGGNKASTLFREQHRAGPAAQPTGGPLQPLSSVPPAPKSQPEQKLAQRTEGGGQPAATGSAAAPADEDEDATGAVAAPQRAPERPTRRPGTSARDGTAAADVKSGPVPIEVRLPLPAQLTVDGRDYGIEPVFNLRLTPGPHRFTVQKDGFDASVSTLEVRDGAEPLRLNLGAPRDALITVVGAPADAPVKISGAFFGTVADLARKPAPVSMMGKRVREVEITIGDRTFKWTLKAGQEQAFDYAKHERERGGAP